MKGPQRQLTAAIAAAAAAAAAQRPGDVTAAAAAAAAAAAEGSEAEGSGQRWWLDVAAGQSGADGRSDGAVGRGAQKISNGTARHPF